MKDKRLITNKLKYLALSLLPSLGGAGGGYDTNKKSGKSIPRIVINQISLTF
jgi:hypothetical protein